MSLLPPRAAVARPPRPVSGSSVFVCLQHINTPAALGRWLRVSPRGLSCSSLTCHSFFYQFIFYTFPSGTPVLLPRQILLWNTYWLHTGTGPVPLTAFGGTHVLVYAGVTICALSFRGTGRRLCCPGAFTAGDCGEVGEWRVTASRRAVVHCSSCQILPWSKVANCPAS